MSEREATTTAGPITAATTINEAVLRVPASVAVFHRYGLDACCGGGLPIAEAARRHGLDGEEVVAAVRAAGE